MRSLCVFLAVFSLMVLDSLAGNLQAATILVPDNYRTIREAVSNASPGDIIIVKEGLYGENIVIKKNLMLKSAKGPENTTIRAALKGYPAVLITNVDGVVLSGFTLTGSGKAGLSLYRANDSRIENNRADSNYNGVTLEASRNNILRENTANSNTSYGFYLLRSNGNRIESNTANSNQDQGFFFSYSNNNTVVSNKANLNTWNGITLWDSHGNTLKDNVTLRNAFGIVTSDSEDNTMDGNTSLPNIFLILPVVLIYIGILSYLVQKNILRYIYKV